MLKRIMILMVVFVAAETATEAGGRFPKGYCTYHACVQFDAVVAPQKVSVNWRGNAGDWYTNANANGWKTTTSVNQVVPGSIIVWRGGGGGGFGHVAFVTSVTPTTITISEMNAGSKFVDARNGVTDKFGQVTTATLRKNSLDRGKLIFAGFILPQPLFCPAKK